MVLANAFIVNLAAFFTWSCMAVRKFKLLTAVNVGRGAIFLLFVVLLFSLGYLDYHHVIFASLSAYFLALLALAFWFRRYLWGENPFSHCELKAKQSPLTNTSGVKSPLPSLCAYGKQNIDIGIFVLLGNFVVVLFMTIDRLMVSSFFPVEQFAIYAFALMVAMIAHTFVGAISQVFFSNLSVMTVELRTRAYKLGKPAIILAWASILLLYFPVTRLIEFYLPHYTASLPIMQILLCTVGFGSLIQILHVSYYLAYRKQRQYFLRGITALALSAILNLLAIKVWGTLESVAIAILISFSVSYIMNDLSLKSVVGETGQLWKGVIILCNYLAAFWFASFLVEWFVAQMLIYIGFFCLISCFPLL